jgi:hypothetical protein
MRERVIHKTTPEEVAEIDRLAALAEQDGPDMLRRAQLKAVAANEPSFAGKVRRAIMAMSVSYPELARTAGVDLVTFDNFCCGTVELPLPVFERVARKLGLDLVESSAMEPAGV